MLQWTSQEWLVTDNVSDDVTPSGLEYEWPHCSEVHTRHRGSDIFRLGQRVDEGLPSCWYLLLGLLPAPEWAEKPRYRVAN